MIFLESSGEQVPKKMHNLLKRGSDRLDRFLDGSHKPIRKDSTKEGDYETKRHRNSMEYKPEQSRLDTIPSPNLMREGEQDVVNESLLISPIEEFGRNSYGSLPLIPAIPKLSYPHQPLSANINNTSIDSLHAQDTISLSTSIGTVPGSQLPERLIDTIALNYCK